MDIDILLALQGFREGPGDLLKSFMSKMTFLGEVNTVLVIMAVVYWCVSKEFGAYLMMGWSGNRLINGVLKVSACVYRPWIRDARIEPLAGTRETATGYSFPSGHSTNAATVYGGAMLRKELPAGARIALGLTVFLVMFSRCFVGVHTPQDVLVGAGMSLLVMLITREVMAWLTDHPGKDVAVMCTGLVIGTVIAVYAAVKPYPTDYDEAGKLIVDGAKMAKDTFKGVGWCAGFLVGWVLERRCVGFTTDVTVSVKLVRLVVGVLGYYAVSLILVPLIENGIASPVGPLAARFLQTLFIALIFPWMMRKWETRGSGKERSA